MQGKVQHNNKKKKRRQQQKQREKEQKERRTRGSKFVVGQHLILPALWASGTEE